MLKAVAECRYFSSQLLVTESRVLPPRSFCSTDVLHASGQTSRLRCKPESSSLARKLSAVNINFFSRTHIHAGAVRTEVSERGLPKDFKVPKFRPLWQPHKVQQTDPKKERTDRAYILTRDESLRQGSAVRCGYVHTHQRICSSALVQL